MGVGNSEQDRPLSRAVRSSASSHEIEIPTVERVPLADRGLGLRVLPHFYCDDSASGDPGIAVDPDPISEVLVVAVEEALDLRHSGLFRFDLTAVRIAC